MHSEITRRHTRTHARMSFCSRTPVCLPSPCAVGSFADQVWRSSSSTTRTPARSVHSRHTASDERQGVFIYFPTRINTHYTKEAKKENASRKKKRERNSVSVPGPAGARLKKHPLPLPGRGRRVPQRGLPFFSPYRASRASSPLTTSRLYADERPLHFQPPLTRGPAGSDQPQ